MSTPWTTNPPPDEWAPPPPTVVPDPHPRRRAGDKLWYGSAEEWVAEWLLPLYRRQVTSAHRIWCPRIWRHREAVTRLGQLWLQWEAYRNAPNGAIGDWMRDSLDYHMGVLTDPEGPLKGCRYDQHADRPLPPLEVLAEDDTDDDTVVDVDEEGEDPVED